MRRDAGGVGYLVDAHLVEADCREQFDPDRADSLLRCGGATTYPSGRFLAATHTFFAPCVSFCTRCHYSGEPSHSEVPLVTTNSQVGSLIYRLPDGVRPQEESMSDRDNKALENDLVEESLVEEVSIDGMCGVY